MTARLFSLVLLLCGVLLGFCAWLLGTGEGAAWLIGQAGRSAGIGITTEAVEGRLVDRLAITGLAVDWGDGRISLRQLRLAWSPGALLQGRLVVESLQAEGVDLEVAGGDGPAVEMGGRPEPLESLGVSPPWPLPDWLQGEVHELLLADFNYLDGVEATAIAERIEASLKLADGRLEASTANYLSPYVNLRGRASWDLHSMDLDYRAEVSLPEDLVAGATLKSAGLPDRVAGHLQVRGDWRAYRGQVELAGEAATLAGKAYGTLDGVWLRGLEGDWLQGGISGGELDLDWSGLFRMDWRARLDHLNPLTTGLGRAGDLSFDSRGRLQVPDKGPVVIAGDVRSLAGQLEGHPLQGEGAVRWAGDELQFDSCRLVGDELTLNADGSLDDRLQLTLQVDDLGKWLAEAGGRIEAEGWLSWHDGRLFGHGHGEGGDVRWQGWQAEEFAFQAGQQEAAGAMNLTVRGRAVDLNGIPLEDLQVQLDGWPWRHRLSAMAHSDTGRLAFEAAGGWDEREWLGEVEMFETRLVDGGTLVLQQPAGLRWSRRNWALAPALLTGEAGENLRLAAHYRAEEREGDIAGLWQKLKLERFAFLVPEFALAGVSSGHFSLALADGHAQLLDVAVDATGELRHAAWQEALSELHLTLGWDLRSLRVNARLAGSTGGHAQFQAESHRPLGLAIPESGELDFSVAGVDLSSVQPWLPPGLSLRGGIELDGHGTWLGGGRFHLASSLRSRQGRIAWQDADGVSHGLNQESSLDLDWHDEALGLAWDVELGSGGILEGEASLPLAAHWPPTFDQAGPLSGRLQGRVGEASLLESLLPVPVEEVRGRLALDLQAGGSWDHPDWGGTVELQNAGVYLPQLGISLRPIEMELQLAGNELQVRRLRLVSNGSELHGVGGFSLHEDRIAYRLSLTGENFKAVDLPELSVALTPRLELEGHDSQLRISGEIRVPSLELRGVRSSPAVAHSSDVVLVDEHGTSRTKTGWRPELQLQVILGDQVRVNTSGLTARLSGGTEILLDDDGAARGKGEIRVAEGAFSAYGVKLKVHHGRLIYRDDPLDNPSLDILALRDAGQVQAGVQISGTARRHRVDLYARPAMPEKDILYAILTGHQASQRGEEGGMVALGAGALLAPGEGLLSSLGLTNIDIQGLFAGAGGLRLRHRFFDRWEIESVLGVNSGVDLFYLFEFR